MAGRPRRAGQDAGHHVVFMIPATPDAFTYTVRPAAACPPFPVDSALPSVSIPLEGRHHTLRVNAIHDVLWSGLFGNSAYGFACGYLGSTRTVDQGYTLTNGQVSGRMDLLQLWIHPVFVDHTGTMYRASRGSVTFHIT
jgi:hypothetical protein